MQRQRYKNSFVLFIICCSACLKNVAFLSSNQTVDWGRKARKKGSSVDEISIDWVASE